MNPGSSKRWLMAVIMLTLFLPGSSLKAAVSVGLSAPVSQMSPGTSFYVDLWEYSSTYISIGQYDVSIGYDPDVVEIVGVESSVAAQYGLNEPALFFNKMGNNFTVFDSLWGATTQCPQYSGKIGLVKIKMRVKNTAPLGETTPLSILAKPLGRFYYLYDCATGAGIPLDGGTADSDAHVTDYVLKTTHLQQYLDVDADAGYALNEGDVDFFTEIINKYRYNVGGTYQVKLGGIQMDFRGNARPDIYDLGSADAVARPTRFVRSGSNGICESTADAADKQEITVGQGYPYAIGMAPGNNNIIDSIPGGDDTITGMVLTTGANGIAETTKLGDDKMAMPLGNGQGNQICVSPGADGKLTTTAAGDDIILNQVKPTGRLLTDDYLTPGRPLKLEVVYPPPDAAGDSHIYLPKATTTAFLVRLVDEFGNPKSGISPNFTVTTGTARFLYNGYTYNVFEGQPADQFLTLGNAPEGAVGGLLRVPEYSESTIRITVQPDPNKGIVNAITKYIDITCIPYNPPASLGLGITPKENMVYRGDISAFDYQSNPSIGYARRIKLVTNRNLAHGCLGAFDGDCGDPVVSDDFETGLAKWYVSSTKMIRQSSYGTSWLGDYVVSASSSLGGTPYMTIPVNLSGFTRDKLKLSFQWRFQNYNSGYGSKLEVWYQGMTYNWVKLREIYGQGELAGGERNFVWEEIDLSGVNLNRMGNFTLKFTFNLSPNEVFYIDNFAISGFHTLLNKTFDGNTVGAFPSDMDYSNYINVGINGVNLVSSLGKDDVALFPYNQGEPDQPAIWMGMNKVLDTTPAGDDMIVVVDGQTVVTTGANGICDTKAGGDDFQLIGPKYGQPYARAVLPGPNQVLDSTAPKDNEKVDPIGRTPSIVVDTVAGGAEGTLRAVTLGRGADGTMADYAFEKQLDLGDQEVVYLVFYSKTLNMAQSTNPKPQFVCEVSDDGAHSWVTVWDFEGTDHDWTYHEIPLHKDPRFNLVDGFIIRWRAATSMAKSSQAAYVDQVRVIASSGEVDFVAGRAVDRGDGGYYYHIRTYTPGAFEMAAVYVPEAINYSVSPYDLPIASGDTTINASLFQVDPRSVKVVPATFSINACERISYMVIGKKAGESKYTDLTDLYRLEVHGPGRMVSPGVFEAECFVGVTQTEKPQFYIRAIPLVSTLEDPTFSGSAIQTGLVSGKIFLPSLLGAATATLEVVIPNSGSIYGTANSTGNYIFGTVPTGTNYTVNAAKLGYGLNYKGSVSVSAGNNTTVNIILKNSTDCDGDGNLDEADIDDDSDGLTDSIENVKSTQRCNFDSDGDGWGDGDDLFPADGTEWMDSDNDGIGNNDETDDDADGLTDSEESGLGPDGFITNGQDPDTDHDGYTDYVEYSNSTDPTVYNAGALDSDTDGLFNGQEQGGGTCGASWNKLNTKSNLSLADTDGDSVEDYTEVYSYNTNPSCHDTDLDGLHDNVEGSALAVKPCPYANNYDSDGDGLCDGNTAVMAGSTVLCADGEDLDADKVVDAGETNPCNPDSDGDIMPDGWEVQYGLTPTVANAAADPDNDTLNNITEYINNANPFNPDTDGDGIRDDVEVANGLNPAIPNWGTINVSSDPIGAKVYLDGTQVYRGQYIGVTQETMIQIQGLKNEAHTITIVANNYFVYQKVVEVTLGQTYTVGPKLAWRKYEVFTTSTPVMANGQTVQTSSYAAPHVVDLERNGSIDLFLGTGSGAVVYYANSSIAGLTLAAGVTVNAGGSPIAVGARAKPFVVDWNNDNKYDLLVGNSLGEVWLFTGNGGTSFNAGMRIQSGGTAIVVAGGNSAPVVVDWDGDNRKDLIVGTYNGYFYRYLNTGTDAAPAFVVATSITDINGAAIDAGTYATPIVYDVLRHGYLALGFGNNLGQISGCAYNPAGSGYHCYNPFLSTTYSDTTTIIDVGNNAAASIADVNGDKQLDMFVGNSAGSLVYYQSSHLAGDIDRSTKVDAGDWIQIKQSMDLCKGNGGYNPGADLTADNCVTSADLTKLYENLGKTY